MIYIIKFKCRRGKKAEPDLKSEDVRREKKAGRGMVRLGQIIRKYCQTKTKKHTFFSNSSQFNITLFATYCTIHTFLYIVVSNIFDDKLNNSGKVPSDHSTRPEHVFLFQHWCHYNTMLVLKGLGPLTP